MILVRAAQLEQQPGAVYPGGVAKDITDIDRLQGPLDPGEALSRLPIPSARDDRHDYDPLEDVGVDPDDRPHQQGQRDAVPDDRAKDVPLR